MSRGRFLNVLKEMSHYRITVSRRDYVLTEEPTRTYIDLL